MLERLLFLQLFFNSAIILSFYVNGKFEVATNNFKTIHQNTLLAFSADNDNIYHLSLDEHNLVTLDWIIDYNNENLIFEVHLPSNFKWFAIGFSEAGDFFPADYCILWHNWRNDVYFQDAHADNSGVLQLDEQQDCVGFKLKRSQMVTKFTYQRKFDTCDEDDYVIEDGTTHVLWAKGSTPLYKVNGLNVSVVDNNMVRVQLLKNTFLSSTNTKGTEILDIVTSNAEIPNVETTYWCHIYKLPLKFNFKHHVYQYEAVIDKENEGIVHHMEVFHCIAPVTADIPLYVGSCFAAERPVSTQVCKRVLAAWAMGAAMFMYPEEAGLPIGGPDFNKYLMLEVHYNNPKRRSGIIDKSGIRFYISKNLRSMDAGIIELGLEYTDKMAIPPHQSSFLLTGYCVSECTAISLPPQGIMIFASQLHTHLTGTKVWTKHFRNGRELLELNRDNHYSTHFQEIRRLKRIINVLPGDALVTTCEYNTKERNNITLGGFAINDEMCVNYIHYFPATTLEVCKSAISDQALSTLFEYMKEWEYQDTSNEEPISVNYNAISWNPMRVELLKGVYSEAPLSMQCNMSSGDRFPGYWENTPRTTVLFPLPPPVRNCEN